MTDTEAEVLDVTRRLIEAVYRRDLDFYRAHATGDMSAYEWFIAPARIDGLDFHLHLMGAGGMVGVHEQSRVDLLDPRVSFAARRRTWRSSPSRCSSPIPPRELQFPRFTDNQPGCSSATSTPGG